MAASTFIRLTQPGACAACGFYPGRQYHGGCQPEVVRAFKRGYSRRAPRDARLSAAVRNHMRLTDKVLGSL